MAGTSFMNIIMNTQIQKPRKIAPALAKSREHFVVLPDHEHL